MKENIRHYGLMLSVAVPVMLGMGALVAGPASASGDPILTEFDNLEAKVTAYGTAIVALVILSVVVFLGLKFLKKGAAKA